MNDKKTAGSPQLVRKVVIAGGGTSGWITAAALVKKLGGLLDITLIESDAIGTVGVGESTIPPMRNFNKLLGIDEQEFMRQTQATFKLGISFENWRTDGDSYIHSFGRNGKDSLFAQFHHFWLRGLEQGIAGELGDYCLELKAAREQKFAIPKSGHINYAYHLDATRYAKYLRSFCESLGVQRVEGKIAKVNQDPQTGFIKSLDLEDGRTLEGDLFIDCTGFRALLTGESLGTEFEEWDAWLPCDRAIPVQTEAVGPPVPYTRAVAHHAGWRWRIPLQTRVGNGIVYCSRYMSDDEAREKLLADIEGQPLNEPRVIKFHAGRRSKAWNKNCVAIGLSSGFLEPLESTSIHLIVTGVLRLIHLFPFGGMSPSLVNQYNQLTTDEIEAIRDFVVLHYHATERSDSPFWDYCRTMEIPRSLSHRLEMFRENAQVYQEETDLFAVDSWVQVMLGQGVQPQNYHHIARALSDLELKQLLDGIREPISRTVDQLPRHKDFLDYYCKSE